MVGYYSDPTTGAFRGFVYDGTGFTPLDVPGARQTVAQGVSGSTVIGAYFDEDNIIRGFLYTPDVAAVPEPASVALLAVGAAGLAARRARRGG